MKTWSKKAMVVAVVAALGIGATSVMARGGWHGPHGGPGMPPGAMMNEGGWGPEAGDFAAILTARIDQYMAWLKPTLALRDNQDAAWQRFSNFVSDHVQQNATRMQEMRSGDRPANVVERFEWREKSLIAMQESVSAMKSEVELFYNQLDAQQKQTFDANFTMGSGPGAMGHRGPGPRGGGYGKGGGWCW